MQRLQPSLRRLLDQAKENIDVIDFRKPSQRADRDQVILSSYWLPEGRQVPGNTDLLMVARGRTGTR